MNGVARFVAVAAMVLACMSGATALAQCTENQKLTASDAAAGDLFGVSVSVSGDTAIVGASHNDCTADINNNCGVTYIYRFDGIDWVEEQILTPTGATESDMFGNAVSISGETAVVGAFLENCEAGFNCGSAYVFRFDGTGWVEEQKLTASDAAAFDFFGGAVSVSGDTVVVGANEDDCAAGSYCGSAYMFRFNGTVWVEEQKLTASDAAAGDWFGLSVSVSGNTAVVGALFHDCAAGSNCGSAYVFRFFNGTSWVEEQKLAVSDAAADDQFGFSVSVSGDTVVVGAFGDDSAAGNDRGSAYVFRFNGTSWVEQKKLTAPDAAPYDRFGYSVSVSGDRAVVGAWQDECAAGSDCGSAYVFQFNGTFWVEDQKLTASDADQDDRFGISVSVSGDTAFVGASRDDCTAGHACGAAYVFDLADTSGLGPADPDCDGDVDLEDFASFQAQFSGDQFDFVSFLVELTGPQ